jgi:hypothetical protein
MPSGSSRLMLSQPAASASVAAASVAHVQIQQLQDSPSKPPPMHARASLPSMHIQQQQSMPWHQQQLQQQPQQHSANGSQLAQCLPPWDQSSFMGGTSSFMSPSTGLEGNMPWIVSSQVTPVNGLPQQMHAQMPSHPQVYPQPQQHAWSSKEYQAAMLMSTMSDIGSCMSQHAGADGVHAGAHQKRQQMRHPVPGAVSLQQGTGAMPQQRVFSAQSLPAQPGNPFASAMTAGSSLAEVRSTSFAT